LAFQGYGTDLKYALAIGDPSAGPPPMTLREFCERYDLDPYETWGLEEGEEPDWDRQLDLSDDFYHDTWMYREAPEKLAYELLNGLDLGPKLTGDDAVGELRLEHGSTMVSSYWNVEAADEITLSLLQERLNALDHDLRCRCSIIDYAFRSYLRCRCSIIDYAFWTTAGRCRDALYRARRPVSQQVPGIRCRTRYGAINAARNKQSRSLSPASDWPTGNSVASLERI
jgi:hypothetical protein